MPNRHEILVSFCHHQLYHDIDYYRCQGPWLFGSHITFLRHTKHLLNLFLTFHTFYQLMGHLFLLGANTEPPASLLSLWSLIMLNNKGKRTKSVEVTAGVFWQMIVMWLNTCNSNSAVTGWAVWFTVHGNKPVPNGWLPSDCTSLQRRDYVPPPWCRHVNSHGNNQYGKGSQSKISLDLLSCLSRGCSHLGGDSMLNQISVWWWMHPTRLGVLTYKNIMLDRVFCHE